MFVTNQGDLPFVGYFSLFQLWSLNDRCIFSLPTAEVVVDSLPTPVSQSTFEQTRPDQGPPHDVSPTVR